MVNLLSTDAEKLIWFVQYLAFIVLSPLQVAIVAWLCYQRMGIPAIIGLIVVVLMLPLQGFKIMSFDVVRLLLTSTYSSYSSLTDESICSA